MKLYEKMNRGVYVIAEMSANHAGKIENAFKIIEEAAKAGADCVKIQTYTADTLTIDCREEPYQIKGGLWDGYNYYQLYQAAYTPWEWQRALRDKCREAGVDFCLRRLTGRRWISWRIWMWSSTKSRPLNWWIFH